MTLPHEVRIPAGPVKLDGLLIVPAQAHGIVLFVHGSGSSRHSPRNRFVAQTLNDGGLATLLFDLLTPEEESEDIYTRQHRFNIDLLARRLSFATDWILEEPAAHGLRIGYFGSSTGGGAAAVAGGRGADAAGGV